MSKHIIHCYSLLPFNSVMNQGPSLAEVVSGHVVPGKIKLFLVNFQDSFVQFLVASTIKDKCRRNP